MSKSILMHYTYTCFAINSHFFIFDFTTEINYALLLYYLLMLRIDYVRVVPHVKCTIFVFDKFRLTLDTQLLSYDYWLEIEASLALFFGLVSKTRPLLETSSTHLTILSFPFYFFTVYCFSMTLPKFIVNNQFRRSQLVNQFAFIACFLSFKCVHILTL